MGQDRDDFTAAVTKPEPVVAVTVTCNLGGERQMQLAAHFGRDASPEEQNVILDKVMKVADRQKARYDLEKLEENFNVCGMNTRNLLAGLPVADNVQKMHVAKLKIELDAKVEARDEVNKEGYEAWQKSGKRGTYKAGGHLANRLATMDADIQKVRDAIAAAPKDADQEREKLVNTIKRHQEDLRLRRKVINDTRGLAGLSPNTEFEDAENAKV